MSLGWILSRLLVGWAASGLLVVVACLGRDSEHDEPMPLPLEHDTVAVDRRRWSSSLDEVG